MADTAPQPAPERTPLHPVYGVHVLFIVCLWAVFLWAAFAFPPGLTAIRSAGLFWGLVAAGCLPAATGFVLLRKGGLAVEPAAMFRWTAWGDALTALALAVLLPVFRLSHDAILFMATCLGALVILQTHVPFVDDEALDPPELKAILDEAGLRE